MKFKLVLVLPLLISWQLISPSVSADEELPAAAPETCSSEYLDLLLTGANIVGYVTECAAEADQTLESGFEDTPDFASLSCAGAVIQMRRWLTQAENSGVFDPRVIRELRRANGQARQSVRQTRARNVLIRQQALTRAAAGLATTATAAEIRQARIAAAVGLPPTATMAEIEAARASRAAQGAPPIRPRTTLAGIDTRVARPGLRAGAWANRFFSRTRLAAIGGGAVITAMLLPSASTAAGECDTNSPIPITQNEDGSCELNLQVTQQLIELLQNPDEASSYARNRPEFCQHLGQLVSYMYSEAVNAMPHLSNDLTLSNNECSGSNNQNYAYVLTSQEAEGQFDYSIRRTDGSIRITGGADQLDMTISYDAAPPPTLLSVDVPGVDESITPESAIGGNDDHLAMFGLARSFFGLDQNYFGPLAQNCCDDRANNRQCLEMNLRPGGGAAEEAPEAEL